MSSMPDQIAGLERAQRDLKRTLVGHAIFVGACCMGALLLRRFLRFPPLLAWTVYAVSLAVFSGDIARWWWGARKLNRLRGEPDLSR